MYRKAATLMTKYKSRKKWMVRDYLSISARWCGGGGGGGFKHVNFRALFLYV